MNRFVPATGLDERIAVGAGARAVSRAADSVGTLARAAAPDAKVWVTAHDERVRPSHADADTQLIPANLRFLLRKVNGGGVDQARAPRDPDLPFVQRVNCRCVAPALPGAVARAIVVGPTVAVGGRVTARVQVRFPRVVDSEFASRPDTGGGWFRGAARATAARMRNLR